MLTTIYMGKFQKTLLMLHVWVVIFALKMPDATVETTLFWEKPPKNVLVPQIHHHPYYCLFHVKNQISILDNI